MTGAELINLIEANRQEVEWHVIKYEAVVLWTMPIPDRNVWSLLWQYEMRGIGNKQTVEGYQTYYGMNETQITCEVRVRQQGKVVCEFVTQLITPATKPQTDPYPALDALRGRVLSMSMPEGSVREDVANAFLQVSR